MADRYFKDTVKTLEGAIVKLYGSFVTTTGGVIGSQSCKGFSITKVAAEVGRYRIALEDSYTALKFVGADVIGAADAAYSSTGGSKALLRNNNVSAHPAWFDLQFVSTAANADAELENGASVLIEVSLKNTTGF